MQGRYAEKEALVLVTGTVAAYTQNERNVEGAGHVVLPIEIINHIEDVQNANDSYPR